MSQFMKPQIDAAQFFRVETSDGTEIVRCYDAGRYHDVKASTLADHCRGRVLDPDETIASESGYLARMSASGYLDCTDWTAHATEAQALAYLLDMYEDSDSLPDTEGGSLD